MGALARTQAVLAGAIVVLVAGCAANSETFEAPRETRPPAETPPVETPRPLSYDPEAGENVAENEAADATTASEAAEDEFTVVIDPGESEPSTTKTLLEAAAAERERRRTAPPPVIVITNENLAAHATGELTIVSSGARVSGSQASAQAGSDPAGGSLPQNAEPGAGDQGEEYWRDRVLKVRSEWRQTVDEIVHLEERVAELRRQFYAEDDPYYRDTQIKPSWDQTLERLEEARVAEDGFRAQLDQVLEEGRAAGALPGWLREGIELEPDLPDESESQRVPEHQPQEPTIVEEGELEAP